MSSETTENRVEVEASAVDYKTQKREQMERRNKRNEDLARFILSRTSIYLIRINKALSQMAARYRLQEIAQAIFASLQEYPLLALGVAIVIFTFTLPFLVFIFFTMTTAVMAFTGFVLIEGALITAASVMLVSLLIGVFLMVAIIGMIFLTGYYSMSRMYEYTNKFNLENVREYLREM
ncbi:AGAP001040-PA-like protein [Anopheles sinensis]|uniref:AGAP001040-PA-like protein n=1 Tax=Anopheles sinensis TaxID=74873 RepID=A0A084VLT9_ANOSI|nr:AGAP001040-PA-like protein [Anopheles sinensis]